MAQRCHAALISGMGDMPILKVRFTVAAAVCEESLDGVSVDGESVSRSL